MNIENRIQFIHQEKFRAAFWGFIVGDALGVPFEFNSREEMKLNPALGMSGYGTYYQPPGTWSDDTSMMLCVMENMSLDWTSRGLADLFLKWADEAYHTAHNEVFDMGNTTRLSLERIRMGIDLEKVGCFDEKSAGNGSLMRSLPYAFVYDMDYSIECMYREGGLTHRLKVCSDACLLYTAILRNLSKGINKYDVLRDACHWLDTYLINRASDEQYKEASISTRLVMENFHAIPEEEIQSTGYVIHTLEAAVWCFLNSNDYRETVLKAVNLGGDTDTIAAIAGGMAGAYYGIHNIPDEWIKQIARREELEDLFQKWVVNLN